MPLLDKLIWKIKAHLNGSLTPGVLSQYCATGTHHMYRVFQQSTGTSIMSYIPARRLSETHGGIRAEARSRALSGLHQT